MTHSPLRNSSPEDNSNRHMLFPLPETTLTTTSECVPFHLQLTKPLWIQDSEWHTATVSRNGGTWQMIDTKWVVVGDCKFTPPEVEIVPQTTASDPEWFALWLRCTSPPIYLPKGQIIAQAIPSLPERECPEGNCKTCHPQVNSAFLITKDRPEELCKLKVGEETKHIKGLLDTGADVTIIPEHLWPSHWPLQTVVEQVEGVGGLQLAKRSKSVVQIEGSKGQLASVRPFVLNYKAPLWGRDIMAQWGVTIGFLDPQNFQAAVTETRPTQRLNWKTDSPVWVEQWPLSKEKLKVLNELVEEQLQKGHIVESTSPWNSPVFVIQKADKTRWRLLQDLRRINDVIEDMGALQPGMPSPTMLPKDWNLAVIDIKDCFFQIPLHPDDAPRFAFSVPNINREAPRKRYHWKAIIYHYTDDVLVCAPNDDLLTHALDLTVNALIAAGFELQEQKVQKMSPWKYLGLEIGKRTIVPQKLAIKTKIETLADVHQLCGALNWVRPWLGLSTEDLASLFNLLKGREGLSSPRSLTPEARKALEKVQHLMSTRQASQCDPDLLFRFVILGDLPHLHGMIFQWDKRVTTIPQKDRGGRDPLLIIEWVFLSHQRSKRMTRPQELMADLIRKARIRIRELAGCDFEYIHVPI
ncbi:hypothetical protein HGM15179_018558 [Zosterops borbonicus]|uniref:ribonuclease H n=1 Tax=Zosterops borbonicus TaxID=364589 RepID=A0A8K1FYH8_9PASS|nr:hypothetical protein HGM15179_018558 [Zosterops borbonicus]